MAACFGGGAKKRISGETGGHGGFGNQRQKKFFQVSLNRLFSRFYATVRDQFEVGYYLVVEVYLKTYVRGRLDWIEA